MSRDIEVVASLASIERQAARELIDGATDAGIVNVRRATPGRLAVDDPFAAI
jgi:hypothetical protein